MTKHNGTKAKYKIIVPPAIPVANTPPRTSFEVNRDIV